MAKNSRPSNEKRDSKSKSAQQAGPRAPRSRGRSTKQSGRSRRAGRERVLLYGLLVVIGVLLAVLVTMLPDAAAPDVEAGGGSGAEGVGPQTEDGAGESRGRDAGAAAERGRDGEAASDDGESALPSRDELAEESVTERYPQEESVPKPLPPPEGERDEYWWIPPAEDSAAEPGTLYLILDDAGNAPEPLPAFLEFPGPVAVAVLPQLPYSVESAARAAAAGKEIMLHLPMEARGGANPGPGAITSQMSDRAVVRTMGENLASVPGAIGINNHMGSAGTADERLMEIVLADAKRRGLFFVDSRTTVETRARPIAAVIGTPFAERHVFLDNVRTRESILESLRAALLLAQSQEHVVMIGHATVPELAGVLNEAYPVLVDRGYKFGAISDLVEPPVVVMGDP